MNTFTTFDIDPAVQVRVRRHAGSAAAVRVSVNGFPAHTVWVDQPAADVIDRVTRALDDDGISDADGARADRIGLLLVEHYG